MAAFRRSVQSEIAMSHPMHVGSFHAVVALLRVLRGGMDGKQVPACMHAP